MLGVVLLFFGVGFAFRWSSDASLQNLYGRGATAIDTLYMSGLEISFDPVMWLSTNMSWPVVRTTEQVWQAISSNYMLPDGWVAWWKKNVLVIAPQATVEDFPSLETMFLITDKYLVVAWSSEVNEFRIISLISAESSPWSWIVITKPLLTEVLSEGAKRITANGGEVRRALLYTLVVVWVVCLPLIAFLLTGWLSVGMLFVTLISRLLSKFWVRVSYRHLFTWLSLSYLPLFLLLKVLTLTGILPAVGIIWYIVMVGCLAVYIVRVEKTTKQ